MNSPSPLSEFVGIGLTDKCAELTVEDIRAMAAARGYDLVPRMTAQQANDFALACRLSEDRVPPDSAWQPEDGPPPVTSAPGFDGRAQLVGRDDRDPVGQVLR